MSGQPGAGCDDPRQLHEHRCESCGTVQLFHEIECRTLVIVPSCRCGGRQWGDASSDGPKVMSDP